jgi:hypothetical protein
LDTATGPYIATAPGFGQDTVTGEPLFAAAYAELAIVIPAS